MAILTNAAESNRVSLRYIKEVTWGTTPANGISREMRITSSKMVPSKETKTSEEIRADRMVPSIVEVAAMSGGEVSGEFSAFTHDDFFEGFLLGAWTMPMNGFQVHGTAVSVTDSNTITISGADWTGWLTVGQYVKLEGFTTPANDAYAKIASFAFGAGNTTIDITGPTLVAEAGTAYTKILDAGDVILASTLTAFESGNKINGGGANAFAGYDLKVGQKIYLEGLGKETATITVNATDPVAGDEFTLSDGVDTLTFEFNTTSGVASPGNVFVQSDVAPNLLRTNLLAAIMGQFIQQNLRVSAKTGVAGTKEAGSFAFGSVANVGDQLTVDDGDNAIQFTFAAVASGLIIVAHGATATDSAANLAAAINAHPSLQVTATPTTNTCAVVNDNYLGGALTEETDGGADITTTNFSGGVSPTLVVTNQRATGGVLTESLTSITATAFSGGSATKSGFYTIASLPDDDSIVVTETLSTDANGGGLTVVVKGSHLRNPGVLADITKQSFSIETGFTDVGKYFSMNGQRVGGFSLEVASGEIVKTGFDFMGRGTSPGSVTVLGDEDDYTVLATTGTEVLNATANVGEIIKNGLTLSTAVKSLTLKGSSKLRNQMAVGEKFPAGIGYGRFTMEGKITAYFANLDFFNDFLDHTTVALAFDFEDTDHNKYFFTIPSVKIKTDPIAPGGIDQDIEEEMEWEAQRDPTLNTQFMVDRFSSIYPMAGI